MLENPLIQNDPSISGSFIDAERLLILLQTKASVENSETAKDLDIKRASVRFRSVDFAYDERKPILRGIDFLAEGGTTVALVGETGSGKSTTLKVLHRFYDVTAGSIEIDGQDIRDVTLESLREAIGIVPQDTVLFNQSVMKNVRYGRLDATDEEVYEVCKAASIHDKILTFPDGYESKVGARGVKLSGGEKQRVAIARCLLKNPKILLLDEASSAVDSETECESLSFTGSLRTLLTSVSAYPRSPQEALYWPHYNRHRSSTFDDRPLRHDSCDARWRDC